MLSGARRWSTAAAERPAEFAHVALSDVQCEMDQLSCVRPLLWGSGAVEFERCPAWADESCSDQEAMRQGVSCSSAQQLVLTIVLHAVEPSGGCRRALAREPPSHCREARHLLAPERLAAVPHRNFGDTEVYGGHRRRCRPAHVGQIDDAWISATKALTDTREGPIVDIDEPTQPLDCINSPPVVRLTHPFKIEPLKELAAVCRFARFAEGRLRGRGWTDWCETLTQSRLERPGFDLRRYSGVIARQTPNARYARPLSWSLNTSSLISPARGFVSGTFLRTRA